MLTCRKIFLHSVSRRLTLSALLIAITACQSVPQQANVEVETQITKAPVDQNHLDYKSALDDLKQGKLETVIEALESLGAKAPTLDFLFTNLGLAYLKLGDENRAEAAFQRAISQNKGDAIAYNHLGVISRMRGQFEQAKQAYQTAIEFDQNYAQAYLNLGILYDIYIQDLNLALAQYHKYQSLTDSDDKTVAGWIVDIERRLKSS